MNEFDHDVLAPLSSNEQSLRISGLNGDSNPDPYDAGAVLHQLTYQANIQA